MGGGNREPKVIVNESRINIIGTTLTTGAKGTNSRHWVHDENGIVGALSATDYKQPKQKAVKEQPKEDTT